LRSPIKAVLFDIDDTLFDRELAQQLTLEFLVKVNPSLLGDISRDKLQHAWALSDEMSTTEFQTGSFARVARCRHFLKILDLPSDQADTLTEQYLGEYTSLDVPVIGALKLVRELKKNYKIGVVSNSLADVQYGKLRTLGLTNLLSCIVLSEEPDFIIDCLADLMPALDKGGHPII
jgi:FMN phosphatase YigB (HAD superfamily)